MEKEALPDWKPKKSPVDAAFRMLKNEEPGLDAEQRLRKEWKHRDVNENRDLD